MKKINLKLPIVTLALLLTFSACNSPNQPVDTSAPFDKTPSYSTENLIVDSGSKTFAAKSAIQIVDEAKFGWNLGNTFDAYSDGDPKDGFSGASINVGLSSENAWGQPTTTRAMIKAIKAKGFSSIRIPISWHAHFSDKNYTIDKAWMTRVKEVVDWSIDEGLYVIINVHHDNVAAGTLRYGKGFSLGNEDKNESKRFLYNVWSQISKAFNNGYDEHLIFETMNEPRLVGDAHEWNTEQNCSKCKTAVANINEYNQLIVNTIRESGGNNAKRVIMVPPYAAAYYLAYRSDFKLPNDSAKMTALSVHMYQPYSFAMQSPGETKFTDAHRNQLKDDFSTLNNMFVSKGVPVVIGEMGATNKDNLADRKAWFNYFLSGIKPYKMAAVLWDNNNPGKLTGETDYNEKYGYFKRSNLTWYFDGLVEEGIQARN